MIPKSGYWFSEKIIRKQKAPNLKGHFGPFLFVHKADGGELASVITAMSEDADSVTIEESGDGITSPIIYTLQRPIKMSPGDDAETERNRDLL